jgi:hypothetical protein
MHFVLELTLLYQGEYLEGMQTGQGYMAWGDGRVYRGAWVQSKCTGFGILTHADGRRYEGYYLKDCVCVCV